MTRTASETISLERCIQEALIKKKTIEERLNNGFKFVQMTLNEHQFIDLVPANLVQSTIAACQNRRTQARILPISLKEALRLTCPAPDCGQLQLGHR